MKLKFEIDLGLSPQAKTWSVRLGVPVVLLVAGGIAYATGLTTWSNGEALNANDLNANFQALQTQISALQDAGAATQSQVSAIQAGNPNCPAGYASTGPAASFLPNSIVCVNSASGDQVVKVGTGAAAFWIDRYEASVWTAPNGGTQVASNNPSYTGVDAGVPNNGQTITPFYALSVPNVTPNSELTWFQAVEFCAASGKRLPDGQEWLRAARGTADPSVATDGTKGNPQCNTSGSNARATNLAIGTTHFGSCVSDWGVEDTVGNLGEYTSDWFAGPGASGAQYPWGPGFAGDNTFNVLSGATADVSPDGGAGGFFANLPATGKRGGYFQSALGAGVFAFDTFGAPTYFDGASGFRCVVPNGR